MSCLTKALKICIFLVAVWVVIGGESMATNLQAFTAVVEKGLRFHGYVEPAKKQSFGTRPTDPSRIYLFPVFSFDDAPIFWRDSQGNRVVSKDTAVSIRGTIRVVLSTVAPTQKQKLYIVATINNCPMMPPPDADFPSFPPDNDPKAALRLEQEMRRYDWSMRCPTMLMNQYAFSSLYPSHVQMAVEVGDKIFRNNSFTDTTVVGESYLSVNVRSDDKAIMASLLENDYLVNIKYTIPISEYAGGDAIFNWDQFMAVHAEKVYSSIKKVSSSGSSFLFFKTARRTISESVNEYAAQSSSAHGHVSGHIQVRDDVDSRIEERLTELIYPETSKQDIMEAHKQAAKEAEAQGNADRAALHYKYIQAVAANSQDQMIDVVASLAALAKGNVLGFLAKGFAFQQGSGRGSYSYRRMVSVSDSTRLTKEFSQIMLKSLSAEMSVSIKPPPILRGGYPFRPNNWSTPAEVIPAN